MFSETDALHIQQAAQALAQGELVAFPTETVYGLGARADDDAAVAKIYAAKGRPPQHPLIVHVASMAAAEQFAQTLGGPASALMRHFWPGPLTLIVPRRAGHAAAAAGGQNSIGLRWPSHPVALALLRAAADLGVMGVAAPSANRFGRVSPTTAAHVRDEFPAGLRVLDGGACEVGIESTIVDCTRARPALMRPGRLSRPDIEAVLGQALADWDTSAPRASGTLQAHYAPRARVRLFSAQALLLAQQQQGLGAHSVGLYSRALAWHAAGADAARNGADAFVPRLMPDNAAAAGRELFAVLRELDAGGVTEIWVEEPPSTPDWEGVRDRLCRAAAA